MKALAASVIAAIGLVVGIGASGAPAYAAGSFPSQVCITSSPGLNQCLNNWGGHLASGNPVNYYEKGSGGGYKYNNWDVKRVGTVSTSPAYPFTPGSGLNNDYNGDAVLLLDYQGQYANPTGYCLDSTAYSASAGSGQLKLLGCDGYSTYQLCMGVFGGASPGRPDKRGVRWMAPSFLYGWGAGRLIAQTASL
jgi:hypothetical protein